MKHMPLGQVTESPLCALVLADPMWFPGNLKDMAQMEMGMDGPDSQEFFLPHDSTFHFLLGE